MNRRRAMQAAVAAFSSAAVLGSVSRAEAASRTDAAQLNAAIEQFRKAMVDADKARLVALASERLSFGHSNGVVQTRAEFVDMVVTKKEVFKSIQLTDMNNTIFGDMAVSRHNFVADLIIDGKELSVKLPTVQVWQKYRGQWRMVARQAFKI